jgi:hypothetical protein
MSPKRPAPAPDREGLPTTDQWDRLAAAVEKLTEEMAVIRRVLDHVLDEVSWCLNNREELLERIRMPVTPLTSMPLDPLAPDFGARINGASVVGEAQAPEPERPARFETARQRDLFS